MPHIFFPYSIGFYAVSIPAVFMTNLSKGGFGMGLGVVAVPVMALFLPVHNVVAILLPMLFWTDLIALWEYRRQWDSAILRTAIPAAVCGIGIGVLTFHQLHEPWLRLAIGLTSILFVFRGAWRYRRHTSAVAPISSVTPFPAHTCAATRSIFWGALSGFTSFVANAGEPPLAMYLLPLKLSNQCLAATTAAFFAAVNAVKLVSFLSMGVITRETLLTSILLLPIALSGIYAGLKLNNALNKRAFSLLASLILFAIGLRLVLSSVKAMI